MLQAHTIDYQDGDTTLEGYYTFDDKTTDKKPAVLIAHDWTGKNAFACDKAKRLAELGYVGFALDIFGKGVQGSTKDEKSALIQPFMQDRTKLQNRLVAAYNTVRKLEMIDTANIGIIGFCFGGLCALDLARSGAEIKAAVSFHGLLMPATNMPAHPIVAKILVLHGYDDPMVPPAQVEAFATEMTNAKADWEIDMYGNTMHAFANPQANDPGFGTVYDQQADARSWARMTEFFKEVFGQ